MAWEQLPDLGLIVFAAGALVAFGLGRILHRRLERSNATLVTTIGDAMMLGGACFAVTAMMIGYFVSGERP